MNYWYDESKKKKYKFILTITPSGMIKADRKGKASGLKNLSPKKINEKK